ncbi:MAG: hypothetical protein P4L49_12760 [Desulfosporosinus sp.]|nr:hypothetical protein [Desulfosporosinus sp.]
MKTIRSFIKTYLTAFGLISLPFLILLISSYMIPINPEVIVYGLTFSFLSSLAIAYNFRQYEKSVGFTNENLFLNNLIDSLSKLGYLVKDKTAGSLEFEPTVYAHLFAGNIMLHFADNFATIQGSRLQVRKGLALTLDANERTFQSTSMEECVSMWAEEPELPDSCPVLGDFLVNSAEFIQADERMTEISITMPEDD